MKEQRTPIMEGATMNTGQAAAYLGLASKTLRNYRALATGPRFYIKPGRSGPNSGRVFYSIDDLDAWRDANRIKYTPPPNLPRSR